MRHLLIFTALFFLPDSIDLCSQNLSQQLNRFLQSASLLKTSDVGIIVCDLTGKQNIFEYQADHLYRPASVQKLLTTITALSVLGSDYAVQTSWNLQGDTLIFKGGFDPFFSETELDSLLQTVPKHQHISADVSMMDSVYWGKGWCWDDAPNSFQPYLSPLMLNEGCVSVEVLPSTNDSMAYIRAFPYSPMYSISNQVVTAHKQRNNVQISRNWMQQGNNICVSGVISKPQTLAISVFPSDAFFMSVVANKLIWAKTDDNVQTRSFQRSMSDIVSKTLKESNNLGAESLFCHLASHHSGTTHVSRSEGVDAVNCFIRDSLHLNPSHYFIADGCGLSNYNRVSARLILSFLQYAHQHIPNYSSYLPVSGTDGTLKNRLKTKYLRGRVHAKTGSMSGVSSLAGYLTTANRHTLAFVIINQNMLTQQEARHFQDEFIMRLFSMTR